VDASASNRVSARFEPQHMLLVAPFLPSRLPLYPTPSPSLSRLQSPSTSLDAFGSPIWPPGLVLRLRAFVLTKRSFPSLLGHIPSCSALSTTVPWSRTPSTPLDDSGSPKWPPGLFLRLPFGTAISPPSSICSSPGLLASSTRYWHRRRAWTLLTCPCRRLGRLSCGSTRSVRSTLSGHRAASFRYAVVQLIHSLVSRPPPPQPAPPVTCGASSAYGLSPWVDFNDCVVCRLVVCVTVLSTRTLHLVKQFVGLLESCSTSEALYSSLL